MTAGSRGLREAISAFLDHISVERGLSTHTVAAYRRDLGRYVGFLESLGLDNVRDIRSQEVAGFVTVLAKGSPDHEPLKRSSVNRHLSAVRTAHKFWLAEGLVDVDASSDIESSRQARPLPKALTVTEVLAVLSAPDPQTPVGIRDRAFLEFLYGTGARVSEATALTLGDLDVESRVVRLRGKGGKQRLVPVGAYGLAAVEAYLVRSRPALVANTARPTDALFVNQRGGRLTRQGAWLVLQKAAQQAGVTGHVSPHVLRHSFATHLMDGGADVRVVQELLGHASVTTTQIYTLVTIDKLREVYLTAHPRALS